MKIVINSQYGGFGLSDEAIELLKKLAEQEGDEELLKQIKENEQPLDHKILNSKYYGMREIRRDHPLLIKVVESLGEKAGTKFCTPKIVNIPDDVDWEIGEYDGNEWVAEKHREWY